MNPSATRDQAPGQVERITENRGDIRADFAAHPCVAQIPQSARRRERKNQNYAAADLAHDRDDSRTRPYALRQPRDQHHRGVRLVSDQTAESGRDGRAHRTAEVGNPSDIDAYQAHGAEHREREQRECEQLASDTAAGMRGNGNEDLLGRSPRLASRWRRQLDGYFLLARDGGQTSVTYGITSGRLPSSSLK